MKRIISVTVFRLGVGEGVSVVLAAGMLAVAYVLFCRCGASRKERP